MNLFHSLTNGSALKGVQTGLKSTVVMACVPSRTFSANMAYPAKLERSGMEKLKPGCLLPTDGLDIDIKPSDRILILGAGGGDEMVRFIRNGHECVGLEADRAYARKTKLLLEQLGEDPAILVHSDGVVLSEDIGSFDLILFSSNYYSKIIGSEKRIRLLKSLHKLIKPTGKIYFEFEIREEQGLQAWSYRRPILLIRLFRLLLHRNQPKIEPGVKLTDDVLQLMHYFTRHEIVYEVGSANLAINELFTASSGSILCRRSCPLAKEPANLDRRVLQAVSQL